MNRVVYLLILVSFLAFTSANAQLPFQVVIDDFESSAADSVYEVNVEGDKSRIDLADNTEDFVEGSASMDVHYVIGEYNQWGSFGNLQNIAEDDVTWDWSLSDSLSIWIKVQTAPTHPGEMVFRIHVADRDHPDNQIEEYIYEHTTIFDVAGDWIELRIPFTEREQPGETIPNDEGFILFPTNWGGGTYNNRMLDRDKIVQFNISAITTGWDPSNPLPADSVEISYDNFVRFGARAVPFIMFNGKAVNAEMGDGWAWGQSSLIVEEGAGEDPKTNAIKWTQGNEWNNGWSGIGWDGFDPTWNMFGAWLVDSMKFKMKAPEGTGALRIQIASGDDGKVGKVFTPIGDNQWHDYSIALSDMEPQEGTTNFDTTAVNKIEWMAEGTAVAGTVIYIDNWWTGDPDIDVSPPAAPTNLQITQDLNANLITWLDTPGEPEATYNVYYSKSAIDSVSGPGIEVVEQGIGVTAGAQNLTHILYSPNLDANVSFYYAVTTVDAAGNESDPVVTASSTTNMAKGIATISLETPANFKPDGNLDDWAGITPTSLLVSEGTTYVPNYPVDNDDDCSGYVYLAIGNDSLYYAFDITDDVVDISAENSWEQDSPDLFIGLYHLTGKQHAGYERGSEPDYHIRFNKATAFIDNLGGAELDSNGTTYYWEEKFPSGYTVEGSFSLQDMADAGEDDVYVPTRGDRIPFNVSFSDADGGANVREGILTLSPYDNDTAWQTPRDWMYTWMEDDIASAIEDFNQVTPAQYELSKNYPNPFNPTTTINYTLAKAGQVTLEVFNMLGQRVKTLVKTKQDAGSYSVQFSAEGLSSGIYMYRLQSEGFVQVNKMVLLK
jgi:hypothetical protein